MQRAKGGGGRGGISRARVCVRARSLGTCCSAVGISDPLHATPLNATLRPRPQGSAAAGSEKRRAGKKDLNHGQAIVT